MIIKKVSWAVFKLFVTERSASIHFFEDDKSYEICALDKILTVQCNLSKNTQESLEFENDYKNQANNKLDTPTDSDGSPLQRIKVTTSGWSYQLHGIDFETSKLDSIYSKKVDGSDYGYTIIKFYKLDNNEEVEITGEDLNQNFLDINCIKTIVDWEPDYDLELIGGMLKQKTSPSEDLRMWVIGVPDIPDQYGGSKLFVTSVNLSHIGVEEGIKADGRAAKYLTYNPDFHTSKIRLIFRHSAGFKHKMNMIFEFFKV